MKTVAAGAHYTTVTVDTAEEVKFSFPSTSLSVEAAGGDITVALTDTAQAGDDETITVPDGESRMFIHHRMNVDTYYLTGSGTAKLYASNMGDVNPFSGKSKGGDAGGDNTHYKGTTTTPLENGSTTNPIVIDGESYTAVFGDVVVYGYTEFVFDGTTWSEFGRPFDTTPTSGSTNAVTSDGIYKRTPWRRGTGSESAALGNSQIIASGDHAVAIGTASKATNLDTFAAGYYCVASGAYSSTFGFVTEATANYSHAYGCHTKASGKQSCATGFYTTATGDNSHADGAYTIANKNASTAIGKYNVADTDVAHLLIVGNGTAENARSNILEVSETDMNVNGDIKINNVAIPTPYTTMPTITESMLGKIAMYVGATGGGYTQGCFYVASTDGAAEPTYSWVQIGGGYKEIELYSNDEHAATPVGTVLTLSQDWADFDAIGFVSEFNEELGICAYNEWKVSIISATNKVTLNFDIGSAQNSFIYIIKDTSNSFVVNGLNTGGVASHVQKIIGIKY